MATVNIDSLMAQALTLPPEQRAALAHDLLLSLDPVDVAEQAEISEEWAREIERRLEARRAGDVELLDWRESVERLRRELRERQTP